MKKYLLAVLSLIILTNSCSKDNQPELAKAIEPNSPDTEMLQVNASLEGDLLHQEIEVVTTDEDKTIDKTKALTYQLVHNPGKNYPKPIIKPQEGQKIPVVCVFRNETLKKSVVVQRNWTYKDGKLVHKQEGAINGFNASDLRTHTDGWKLFCFIGTTLRGNDAAYDGISQVSSIREGETVNINTIYYNKNGWVDLKYHAASQTFETKTGQTIPFAPQGCLLLLRATNKTKSQVHLKGFRLEQADVRYGNRNQFIAPTILFEGGYKGLNGFETTANSPILGRINNSNAINILPRGNNEVLNRNDTSNYYIVWVMTSSRIDKTRLKISALYTQGNHPQQHTPAQNYNRKHLVGGHFYSLSPIVIK